ncbi:hypothetical protein [Streptomyces sp. NPDC086787]|uniref:hypothetical protein n=1 Tax=Streptomyces sp. NPDC086787 TaxID=3365759 RepID=UPI0038187F05
MGTKTVDGAAPGTEAQTDETNPAEETTKNATEAAAGEEAAAESEKQGPSGVDQGPSGVGQGAAAVVSAALGLVSLSGGWIGTVAAARTTLDGQLHTASNAGVATQIKAVYGDAWHTTALWAGLFALVALLTGVAVLARPAFGTPGGPQAPWIKSVAWAGVSLGVVGLLLALLKYSDVLLGLPSAG